MKLASIACATVLIFSGSFCLCANRRAKRPGFDDR